MMLGGAQRSAPDGDRLRSVIDSVFADRKYSWEQPLDPFGPVRRAWAWLVSWFQSLRAESPSTYWLLIGVLVAVLLAILGHAAWVAWRTVRRDATIERRGGAHRHEVRDAAWYAREAERLAAAGRFTEAIQADFLRLILQLDARRLVRFHPSRTPNEYAREPTLAPESRRELGELVRRLYAYVFARVPCGAEELRDWRARAVPDRYARA
jgi:uncharacterized protein DUF4129